MGRDSAVFRACIQRPLKGSNESGLLQQVVSEWKFYLIDLRRIVVSEQMSLKAGGLLIHVVSNTSLTHYQTMTHFDAPEIIKPWKTM